ncbi:MAG: adenosylcobinamide-GDP ribazoletransferase, partial [Alphaproteobacteria bacterium]|nr:adenosylcobinamide-GDP ribazoletransferase [Alphaproteobacteria bacterium]
MSGPWTYILETAQGWARDSRVAVAFLTRLPVGVTDGDARPLAAAARAFPIAGLVVGLIAAAALWAGTLLGFPPLLSALLGVGAGVLVTGALHEDGLSDTADALGARGDRDAMLAAMRDSRVGAFGVLALVFSVGMRAAALSGMHDDMAAVLAIVTAHVLARAALPAVMAAHPPARNDGLGFSAGRPDMDGVATAAVLGILLALLLAGLQGGAAAALAAFAAALVLARLIAARLGGLTGDALGAAEQ